MTQGTQTLTAAQHKAILDRFESLVNNFQLQVWESTIAQEYDDLRVLLLSFPTANDVQEYIVEKSTDWTIAIAPLEGGARKMGEKILTVYNLLLGFVDVLEKL
jgi:hypothetical protein